jgi:hypothetical protein
MVNGGSLLVEGSIKQQVTGQVEFSPEHYTSWSQAQ